MPKKSASEKTENSDNQKSVNQAIDAHAKNFLTEAEMKKFLDAARILRAGIMRDRGND